ncbi:MAG TPA: hypothetical protein DDZ34_01530 [Syntrophaceae bacterium]|nr:hypothetical protein [Syntrophaceae bacterium]
MIVGAGERRRRFILVYNPEEAKKDKTTREKTIRKIEEALQSIKEQEGPGRKTSVPCFPTGRWGDTCGS